VAGVQASPLARLPAEKTGVETDRAGRIPVNPDCTVPGHPEVFAIGDMVSLNRLPGVAQPPQQGKYVARVITARLRGKPAPPPFKYFDKGRWPPSAITFETARDDVAEDGTPPAAPGTPCLAPPRPRTPRLPAYRAA
jgi:hypothetical protein